ncbi:Gfo/Idh/MocA family oxidoreductase [Microbispora sp. NBRC 16548]|uniref:Gfo/Idh/MocA family protein n=1 Tax=Microbispora sp. NBRC 16548 TaxID=3030994 RepID=UPI0024A0433D|nr:Gfo/Idh/MocA family oxidoreductase [Microbispora sp. NBRC 16548]GLX05071.1 dehydrogenase [Microbispora sp. NBRC 16548]
METVKVGIAGLGVVAQVVYLPLLARRRDLFRVAAVCDLDRGHAEAVGREAGVPAYDDPLAMLDKGGFDALIVLTPGSHGPLVRAALERGLWVLCEKPLAYSRAELSGFSGERLMAGYMKQYDPASQRLLEALHEAGGPEVVRHLDATVLHPSEESQLLFARARPGHPAPEAVAPYAEADERALTAALGTPSERLRRLYAEVLLSSLCHELSLMRLFTGSPDTVDHVAVWPVEAFPPSLEVSGTLGGECSGRYGIRWHYLPSYPAYHEVMTLHHEHGSLELRFPSPYLLNAPTRLTVTCRVGTTERTVVNEDVAEAFERQLRAFHRFVTQEEPPLTGLDGALEDIVTAQRIVHRYARWAGIPIGGECAQEVTGAPREATAGADSSYAEEGGSGASGHAEESLSR